MKLLAIAAKDLRLLLRDPAALLFLVLVPVVVITIIAETLGGQGSGAARLPVVDEDAGPVAGFLIEALREHVEVELVDRAEAERRVGEANESAAALIVPSGTSKRYLQSRPSQLELLTDPARGLEVNVLKAYLLLAEREAATLADPLYEELLVMEERNATRSRLEIPVFEQNVPGFSVMFVLMGVFFGVAFGLRDEVSEGTWLRIRAAPVGRASYLGGKLLARFAVGLAQLGLLLAFGHLVYGISLGRSAVALPVVACAVVFAMTGFSLLVAGFARTREQVIPLGLTVIMVVCALGGCWWPLYQEPVWLQRAAHFFLTAWAMDGIHDVILRERGLSEVLPVLGVLLAYGAGCLALGVALHRTSES